MDPKLSNGEGEVCPDVARSCCFDRAESDVCFWVYVLQSVPFPEHFYTGFSIDVPERIQVHNRKAPAFSRRFAPWKLRAQIGFADKKQAMAFERYLKTGSGRAFAKMHF